MTEKNYYTHYYLYAKHWYKKSGDVLLDLRVITSNYSGLKVEHITHNDVITVLMNAVRQAMKHSELKNETVFMAFVYKMLNEEKSVDGFIRASLDLLARTKVKDLDLGKPDGRILPLTQNYGE